MNNNRMEKNNVRNIALFLCMVMLMQDVLAFTTVFRSKNPMKQAAFYPHFGYENLVAEWDETNAVAAPVLQTAKASLSKMASNPNQAESSSFSIGSTDGMVDKFTGDFSYSIPLMDVEGYPIVLSYNSNVGMMDEASWVGLGWDLNVGSVTREMRGVPDEFNGDDEIVRTYNQKPYSTVGEKTGGYVAYVGNIYKGFMQPKLQFTVMSGKYTNSYVGIGKTLDLSLGGSLSFSKNGEGFAVAPSFSFGYSRDSKNGIGTNSSIGLKAGFTQDAGTNSNLGGITYGRTFNSRRGITSRSLSLGIEGGASFVDFDISTTTQLNYGTPTSIPRVQLPGYSTSDYFDLDIYFGLKAGFGAALIGFKTDDYTSDDKISYNNNSEKQVYQPAYGFLHSGKRANYTGDAYPVMDYERINDFGFSAEMNNLPFSVQTYDIFHVNASGLGGSFRPHRSDYGTYYDPLTESNLNRNSSIFEDADVENVRAGAIVNPVPFALTLQVGYSTGIQNQDQESGLWNQSSFIFQTQSNGNKFDESAYFKMVGELTPNDQQQPLWNALGGDKPNFFDVNAVGKSISNSTDLKVTGTQFIPPTLKKGIRANQIYPRTIEKILEVGSRVWDDELKSYANTMDNPQIMSYPRQATYGKPNHISQLEVVTESGMQYTYGIPAYSITNSDVSFSATGLASATCSVSQGGTKSTMINYTPDLDNTTSNTLGRDGYFDKTTMPAYPTAFLLTQVNGSDYIDRLDDGPTPDDIGSYYKFNYTRLYGGTQPYKWRFPMSTLNDEPLAFLNEGFLGTELDDMANYTYGEKEIWYLHSIQTRNYVVQFELADRTDGHGVQNENGVIDSNQKLKKIKTIKLYALSELLSNPIVTDPELGQTGAIPLQTVEFDYDYHLCKGVPSNTGALACANPQPQGSGKLTLTKIHIYNGKSEENGRRTFDFTYSSKNPDFDYAAMDAWGCYKASNPLLPNAQYPYPLKDQATADVNASAWKLTSINNSMNGIMEITYEADHYGYVQNKRAMQHFEVSGMTNLLEFLDLQDNSTWDGQTSLHQNFLQDDFNGQSLVNYLSGKLVTGVTPNAFVGQLYNSTSTTSYFSQFGMLKEKMLPNNVMVFKLKTPLTGLTKQQAAQKVREAYFMQNGMKLKQIHFKTRVQIKNGVEDIVPVFADISEDYTSVFGNKLNFSEAFEAIGVMPENGFGEFEYGYVVLNPVNGGPPRAFLSNLGSDNGDLILHPIQRAALDFARSNLVDKVYGSCVDCEGDLTVDKGALWKKNIYLNMILEANYAPNLIEDKSFVSLFEPDGIKYGGNARVKQIVYRDNWETISGEYESSYQWNYTYTNPANKEMGVASFEPRQMLDQNPFYKWHTNVIMKERFPDETQFVPGPRAISLFPNPVVGYEAVRVTFAGSEDKGSSVSKFHTYKEEAYKTIEEVSSIERNPIKPKKNILTGNSVEKFGFGQGYYVGTNNFHGKIDETAVLDIKGNTISRSKYHYYGLDEKLPYLNEKGLMEDLTANTDYDVHLDSRYVHTISKQYVLGLMLSLTVLLVPPFIKPPRLSPIFNNSSAEQAFYSSVMVKHKHVGAIVKSIETEQLGSINVAQNMAYDVNSGQVLLSSLNDEFDDKLYSFNYPAYWFYDEFRSLTDMEGKALEIIVAGDGSATVSGLAAGERTPITQGDQIKIDNVIYRVAKPDPIPENDVFYLVNLSGVAHLSGVTPTLLSSGTYPATLVHCHRDNRLTESMQSVVTKKAPLIGNAFTFPNSEIISASAVNYRNKRNLNCMSGSDEDIHYNNIMINTYYDPYALGNRGDLIVDGSFAWQTERVQNTHQHGIRFDGTYTDYVPFYAQDANARWYPLNYNQHPNHITTDEYQKWRKLGEITAVNEYGVPQEARDQLGIPSAVIYGFNNVFKTLPIAQVVNAQLSDIAFDGFEDYHYFENHLAPEYEFTPHFNFNVNPTWVTTDKRHSGRYSLQIPSGNIITQHGTPQFSCQTTNQSTMYKLVRNSACDCYETFNPSPGKYIVGAWIHNDREDDIFKIQLSYYAAGTGLIGTEEIILTAGDRFDGWQRLEGKITIPTTATKVDIDLINLTSGDVYVDDFRMHPELAGMTTVVYDPATLLPMATHDGYNFTTFYNYDENLQLSRVKVETIEGIRTITETESGGKNNN